MADYGVAVTWNDTRSGRERQALNLWVESIAMNDKAVANGELEKWDAVMFEPSASGPAGAVRLYGTDEQVEAFIRTDEFTDIVLRAQTLLTGFSYRRFMTGQAMAEGFAKASAIIDAL